MIDRPRPAKSVYIYARIRRAAYYYSPNDFNNFAFKCRAAGIKCNCPLNFCPLPLPPYGKIIFFPACLMVQRVQHSTAHGVTYYEKPAEEKRVELLRASFALTCGRRQSLPCAPRGLILYTFIFLFASAAPGVMRFALRRDFPPYSIYMPTGFAFQICRAAGRITRLSLALYE